MMSKKYVLTVVSAFVLLTSVSAMGKTVVAVNPLSASGDLAKEKQIISDIMQAELSVSENITLVDRKNLIIITAPKAYFSQ